MRRAVAAIITLGLIAACTASSASPLVPGTGIPSSGIALRTQAPEPAGTPAACPASYIEGTLLLDEQSESGVVLKDAEGHLLQIIWPNGYWARDDGGRLAVLDGSGVIVAHEGDPVRIGGGQIDANRSFLGCGGTKILPASLEISNNTTLAVTLVVNGTWRRTFEPMSGDGIIYAGDLPPQPWSVEARSPSGRVLASMTVRPGDVFATFYPDGRGEMRGDGVRLDLSCGVLRFWSGPRPLGPVPGPGSPGDCEP